MPEVGSLLTAVDTNTRSPQTIGLDTATPATGVFQRMFSPVEAFHFTAVAVPSATPDADGPRNEGQFCADSAAPHQTRAADTIVRLIDAVRLMAYLSLISPYFSPTRLNVAVLPRPASATPATMSCSIRNVSVAPGCSA